MTIEHFVKLLGRAGVRCRIKGPASDTVTVTGNIGSKNPLCIF